MDLYAETPTFRKNTVSISSPEDGTSMLPRNVGVLPVSPRGVTTEKTKSDTI